MASKPMHCDAPLPPLYVIRHGETLWNVEGRLQGGLDSPLTERGRMQAQMQGRILHRLFDGALAQKYKAGELRILCSPALRAQTTAQIALRGINYEIENRLAEVNLGAWQGKLITSLSAQGVPTQDKLLWKFAAPGGERLPDLTARLHDLLGRVDRPTVCITHGVTSKALRGLALNLTCEQWETLPGGQGNVHKITGKNLYKKNEVFCE